MKKRQVKNRKNTLSCKANRKDIGMENLLYWGLFLNENLPSTLEKPIENQHVTFGYKIEPPEDIIFGQTYYITLLGYGIDEDNEAVMVEIPEELNNRYYGNKPPHITLSVSKKGIPAKSNLLDFRIIEPYSITATMGYYTKDGRVIF